MKLAQFKHGDCTWYRYIYQALQKREIQGWVPTLAPKKALVLLVQHPTYLYVCKCGHISISTENCRGLVMRQAITGGNGYTP